METNKTVKTSNSDLGPAVNRKIDFWKSRLLDFSRRNRLVYFKSTKSSTAEILSPDPIDLFNRLVVKGKAFKFPFIDESDPNDTAEDSQSQPTRSLGSLEIGTRETGKQLNRILYNLRTRSRTSREEQGINILFIVFGFLNWTDTPQGEIAQAPLVLVPVELTREAPGKPYQILMLEDDIVLNPTLEEWLYQSFRIKLPELPDDLDADGLTHFLQRVKSAVRAQANWSVDTKVILSVFSYQKQMMVEDLEQNRKALVAHQLIRAMSIPGFPLSDQNIGVIKVEELDDRITPENTYQVLDADSSQQEAIQAAKGGLSFVLQGPPGTGKSQTIANIIAEFLGEGKRVLFVSSKMAALEVVQGRLNKVGLGDYCLQLHSYKRDKREIVEELGKSLEIRRISRQSHIKEKLESLQITRSKLNSYVRSLHQPRYKLGITVFDAYGILANLLDAPILSFALGDIESLTDEILRTHKEIVSQLVTFPQVINIYHSHPWQGCQIVEFSLQLQNDIEQCLKNIVQDISEFATEIAVLAEIYQVEPPNNLNDGWELVRVAFAYRPEILKEPVIEINQRYKDRYQSRIRYLRPQYWKDSKLLKNLGVRQTRSSYKQIIQDLDFVERVQRRKIAESSYGKVQALDIESLSKKLNQCGKRIKANWSFITKQLYPNQNPDIPLNIDNSLFADIIHWCQTHLIDLHSLVDWIQFNNLRAKATKVGLSSFVEEALNKHLLASEWEAAFNRGFYTFWIDHVVRKDDALRNFHGSSHQVTIDQFRQLDKDQIVLARQRIQNRIVESRPQAGWMNSASTEEAILRRELNKKRRLKPLRRLFNEIPDLILSLRPCLMMSPMTVSQLLNPGLFRFDLVVFDEASQIHPEEAVGAIIRAKQAVVVGDRHQLPPTSFFDVLESDDEFEEDNYQADDFESILNESEAAGLPNKMLLWHYRSRDESLIAFSNNYFYNNCLLTFPAAVKNPKHSGIEFIYIPDGVYKRNGRYNDMEAKQVVKIILEHYHLHPKQSLGVVTFSQAQRDVIQMTLDREIKDKNDLHQYFSDSIDEPCFIKNLELVQGDERDVMVFSIGYGKDEAGRFIMNFGPLNRAGGERRLNVAVTRARNRVMLVSSFQPEEIDLARTESRGVKLLRNYMSLARDGLSAIYADISLNPAAEFESPFEESVYIALTARGIRLQKQIGVSHYRIDMAVVDPDQPGKYILGIECDGAMYHSAATARDRDRLRQEVLENLGWRIHRIWSRDWIENKDREINKVIKALKDIKEPFTGNPSIKPDLPNDNMPVSPKKVYKSDVTSVSHASPPVASTKRVINSKLDSLPPSTESYRCAQVVVAYNGIESFRRANISQLQLMLKNVVESEGPIAINLAKRRITDAYGIGRVGTRINSALEQALTSAIQSGIFRRDGLFLWPKTKKPIVVRVPVDDQGRRSIEEIPPEEIQEGIYLCVRSALSIEKDDLIKQTAKLFGLKANVDTAAYIERSLSVLTRSKRVELRKEKFRLPQ